MVTTTDLRTTVKPYNMNRQFVTGRQVINREVTFSNIGTKDFTYEIIAIPAKSIVMAVYFTVTTAWTGASGTITCGTNDGTEDDVDFYWDTTTGAVANFAVRSIVGAYSPRDYTDADGTDFESVLVWDTAAKNITMSVLTTTMTAGEGILTAEYNEFPKVAG